MVAHSGPISNSDYIGQPSAHSEAQCKRPAQYPLLGGVTLLAVSCVDGPRLARVFSRDEQWSLAVMCPAFQCGLT
jgi:hypothetical protein